MGHSHFAVTHTKRFLYRFYFRGDVPSHSRFPGAVAGRPESERPAGVHVRHGRRDTLLGQMVQGRSGVLSFRSEGSSPDPMVFANGSHC